MSKNEPKRAENFHCLLCDYKTCKYNNFIRHKQTQKHIGNDLAINGNKNEQNEPNTIKCSYCNKQYKSYSGLWRHKKRFPDHFCPSVCVSETTSTDLVLTGLDFDKMNTLDKIDDQSIISQLKDIIIKQQIQLDTQQQLCKQQQDQIGELIPRVGDQNTINNTQNNKISIKMFLDQHCKDAINMTDFVNSIKVSLEQLEYTTEHGLTDGLTKTIMDNMNRLSIYERPLHCTDIKRETLYIKDDDKWSKDDSRERMKLAIKGATNANYRALKDWQGVHPDFRKNERLTEYFTDMILKLGRSLDGIDDKVLKNLCRSTYIKLGSFNID